MLGEEEEEELGFSSCVKRCMRNGNCCFVAISRRRGSNKTSCGWV